MYLLILPVLYLVLSVIGSPISGYKPLTPEEDQRLKNWKETDEQDVADFECEIILTPEEQRNGLVETAKIWPNGEIPYMFGEGISKSQKNFINEVLQDFVIHSCVKPKLITVPVSDYVLVQGIENKCTARVGRQGGVQILTLGPACHKKGTILHEFLHAVGFFHQQSAEERDDYVIIHEENIKPGSEHNFEKRSTNNYNTIYDYLSVMHYGAKSASANGEITIETKDAYYQDKIGKAGGFSETDIIKLNRMYNCPQ